MKVQVLLAAAFAALAAADHHPGAEKICGRLGVMEWDPNDLPEGVKPENIRMCADHPVGARNYWGWGDYLPNWVPANPFAEPMSISFMRKLIRGELDDEFPVPDPASEELQDYL